jgi:hypothetical protein
VARLALPERWLFTIIVLGESVLAASIAVQSSLDAGLAVAVDHRVHASHLPAIGVGYAIAVAVAVFVFSVWALQIRLGRPGPLTGCRTPRPSRR